MMSYLTEDTLLPASSLDSGSENSSLASSLDQPIKNQYFLNNSWPFLDRLETSFGTNDYLNQYSVSGRGTKQCTFRGRDLFESNLNSSGCSISDASTLYSFRGNHYNPSSSGYRTSLELEECTQWINSYLQYYTHDMMITDLTESLADGQTLLYLVEILLGVVVTPVHVKPALEVQKIENIQKCLDILTSRGISMHDVTTEDIVKKNAKIVLALCQSLRKHFGSSTGTPKRSPRGPGPSSSSRSISPPINLRSLDGDRQSSTPSQSPRTAVIDIEDVAILEWVSSLTNHTVKGYESFQDGHVLCLLVNKLTGGAVPDVVLEHGLPSEKISLALTFSEEELGTTIKLEPYDIVKLDNSNKLPLYLQELHKIFLDQKHNEITNNKVTQLVEVGENLKEIKAHDLMSTNYLSRNGHDSFKTTERGDAECEMRTSTGNVTVHFRMPTKQAQGTGYQLTKSSRPRSHQPGQQERFLESGYFLDDKNIDDIDKIWPKQCSKLYYKSDKTHNLDKPRKIDILDGQTCHYGSSDDVMLLPKETIFDPIKWELPFKPLATKSWKKEREKARLKIDFLEEQLKLLKRQYFENMSLEIEKDNSDDSIEKGAEITYAKSPIKSKSFPHKAEKSSSKGLSESFNSYFGKNKGTTPPYRTWSTYINTEGDRYKTLMKNTGKADDKIQSLKRNHVILSPQRINDKDDVMVSTNDVDRLREFQKPDNRAGVISPQIKDIQNTEARDLTKKRLSDASDCSTDSLMASGRRLHGITALVRLSSKKANAVSDSES